MTTQPRTEPIERGTDRTWDAWLEFMRGIGAERLDHHEIATKVLDELAGVVDNPGWWAQAVTVTYEQYMGRRIPGQRPDGTFQMSVSKSTNLTMDELMEAWTDFAAADQEVLDLISTDPRVSGTEKRRTWRTKAHDGSSVVVTSEPKKNGTASIIATQMGIDSNEENTEAKSTWSSILTRFLAASDRR